MPSLLLTICASFLLVALNAVSARSATPAYLTRWRGGNGAWTDAAKWTAGMPSIVREADIGGVSEVTIPRGNFQAAMLRAGTEAGDARGWRSMEETS